MILVSASNLARSSLLTYLLAVLARSSPSLLVVATLNASSRALFAVLCSLSISALRRLASPRVFTLGIERKKDSNCLVDEADEIDVGP